MSSENVEANFEEALALAGMGCYNYKLLFVCFFLLMSVVTEIFGRSFIVTSCTCDLELTTHTKGIIAALPMMGVVLSAHLWGWLADTRGRKTVLLISMFGGWTISFGSSMAGVWPVLAVCGFLSAFFLSASNSVTYALLGECMPLRYRNFCLLAMANGIWSGQIVNAGLAYIILGLDFNYRIPGLEIQYRPWRLLEQVYGATAGISAFLLLFFVKESPKFYFSRGKENDGLRVLSEIYSANSGKKPEEYPVKRIIFEETVANTDKVNVLISWWRQTVPLFKPPLLRNTLLVCYIIIIAYMITPSIMMWMPTIANAFSRSLNNGNGVLNFCELVSTGLKIANITHLANVEQTSEPECDDSVSNMAYVVIPLFSVCLIIVNIISLFLLRVVTKQTLLMALLTVTGVSGFAALMVHHSVTSILLFFMFLGNVICMGVINGFAVGIYPTYLKGMAMCLTMMIGRAFSFILINSAGVLMADYCHVTVCLLSLFILSGVYIASLLPKESTNR